MKYLKRSKIYRNSTGNCTFNPTSMDARSYGWWRFVARIDGVVIFNNYRYSTTTSQHQRKVRQLLAELGIDIDLALPIPRGIQDYLTLDTLILAAEEHLCDRFLHEEWKREERNARARERRAARRAASETPKLNVIQGGNT